MKSDPKPSSLVYSLDADSGRITIGLRMIKNLRIMERSIHQK